MSTASQSTMKKYGMNGFSSVHLVDAFNDGLDEALIHHLGSMNGFLVPPFRVLEICGVPPPAQMLCMSLQQPN